MFNKKSCNIKTHEDKDHLLKNLDTVFDVFDDISKTIDNLLSTLKETSLIDTEYLDGILSDDEYKAVLDVPAVELVRVSDYLKNPNVSTQHGVMNTT